MKTSNILEVSTESLKDLINEIDHERHMKEYYLKKLNEREEELKEKNVRLKNLIEYYNKHSSEEVLNS